MSYPADVPVLTDGRVTLRPHTRDDVEGVYEQCIDPTSIRCTTVPDPYTRDHAADFIQRRAGAWENGSDWGFAIEADGGSGPGRFGGSISVGSKGAGIGEIAFGAHPG
ncbi:MAG: GNAT family N-acetyltransferase, partial [Nocardioidaceae bacterium]|nr:GNAT family N-acetyltransferase [Nocardioidaceae bacterium]